MSRISILIFILSHFRTIFNSDVFSLDSIKVNYTLKTESPNSTIIYLGSQRILSVAISNQDEVPITISSISAKLTSTRNPSYAPYKLEKIEYGDKEIKPSKNITLLYKFFLTENIEPMKYFLSADIEIRLAGSDGASEHIKPILNETYNIKSVPVKIPLQAIFFYLLLAAVIGYYYRENLNKQYFTKKKEKLESVLDMKKKKVERQMTKEEVYDSFMDGLN